MHLKLFELLQSHTASSAASKIVAFAANNDAKELHRVILDFFVNFLDRRHALTIAELDRNDTDEMVMAVYESERYGNKFETPSTIKDFFAILLDRGYQSGVKCTLQETAWINFLSLLVTHRDIPENCAFKATALHLLSLLLNPLAQNVKVPGRGNEDLLKSLQEAIKLVATGFSFATQSSAIVAEFTEAMETHPDVFIVNCTENLQLYKLLMLKENTALHVSALKSLRKLCNNQTIHAQLEEFFFEGSEDDEDSFRNIFNELLTRKSLKIHVIPLMKAIKNLPSERDILSEGSRDLIYMHIFDSNKRVVGETVELMVALGDDVWLQIVRLLNTSEEGQEDITSLLQNLSVCDEVDCSVSHLLKLLCENLEDHAVSQRLASILVAQMKLKSGEHDTILRTLEHLLERCAVDELTFTLMLELVTIIKPESMFEYYKHNMAKFTALTTCLIAAFNKFDSPAGLLNIISTLATLSKLFPELVLGDIRILFNSHYSQFLSTYERCQMEERLADEYIQPITKLSNILEYRSWNILTESNFTTLDRIIRILCNELPDRISLLAIRLYSNFLKHLWARYILSMPVPLKASIVAGAIATVTEGLFEVVETKPANLNEGFYVVRSLLDILVMFQPTMKERYGHKIFKKASIEISKERVKLLGAYVAKVVYGSEKSDNQGEVQRREMILLTWISFCKNYTKFPSLTASEKIVANYRASDPFKAQLDLLLEHLLTQKNSLEQTVSIVAYHYSNNNDFTGFRTFYQALDEFLTRHIKDANKRSATKLGTGISILTKLPSHIVNLRDSNDENRLDVLDLVKIIVRSVDPSLKVKLETEIPTELNTIGLSDVETEYLEAFKASLRV